MSRFRRTQENLNVPASVRQSDFHFGKCQIDLCFAFLQLASREEFGRGARQNSSWSQRLINTPLQRGELAFRWLVTALDIAEVTELNYAPVAGKDFCSW